MYLDDLEFNEPIEPKRTTFQTIVAALEIVLVICILVGFIFKKEAWAYANELLLFPTYGLVLLYTSFSVPLFRSQKTVEHVSVQLFGFVLAAFVLAVGFKMVGSEGSDKIYLETIIQWPLAPIMAMVLSILLYTLSKSVRKMYLGIGLRFLLAWLWLVMH
jgi:hypothetical protein